MTPLLEALRDALVPVAARERRLRALRSLALALAGAAAGLALLRWIAERMVWESWGLRWVMVLAVATTALLLWRRASREPVAAGRVASRVERAFPELRASLLAAVPLLHRHPQPLAYVESRLIEELVRHANAHDWQHAVSQRHLRLASAAAGAAGLVFLYGAGAVLTSGLRSILPDPWGIAVSPGDAEVEQGHGLLVAARFGSQVPAAVTLVVRLPGRTPVEIPMTRALEAPVFSARTVSITGDRAAYHVAYAERRSASFGIRAIRTPEVERIEVRVAYPRQPRAQETLYEDTRELSVTEGARVTVRVHATAEVVEGALAGEGEPVRLRPESARALVAVLKPERSQRLVVRLAGHTGRRNREPTSLAIELKRDLPPVVGLAFPGRDVRVSPLQEVSMEASIADDAAILAHGITWQLADRPSQEVRLGGPSGATLAAPARFTLALEDLGVRAGDLLSYHFWAEDAASDGKRRRARSEIYFAEVRRFEERYREAPAPPDLQGGGEGAGEGGAGGNLATLQKDVVSAIWRLLRDLQEGMGTHELAADVKVVERAQQAVVVQAEESRARAALEPALRHMRIAGGHLAQATASPASPATGLSQALAEARAAYAALIRLRSEELLVGRGNGGGGGACEPDPTLQALELRQKERRYEARRNARPEGPDDEVQALLRRLRELARRQAAVTEALREAETALQARSREEAEAEARERLERIAREQKALATELADLKRRLEGPENRESLGDLASQCQSAESRSQAAANALAGRDVRTALAESLKAEHQLEALRKAVRERATSALAEMLRRLGRDVTRLERNQSQIGQALGERVENLAGQGAEALAEAVTRQKADVGRVLDETRKAAQMAEVEAPLAHRRLQDGLRRSKVGDLEGKLEAVARLVRRGDASAADTEREARALVAALSASVRAAVLGALGDEAAALRAARTEMEKLIADIERDLRTPPAKGAEAANRNDLLTGARFQDLTDRIRDVQDLVGPAGLGQAATGVLDRARAARIALKQDAAKGGADVVTREVLVPLKELRDLVAEALRGLEPAEEVGPLDRDPVAPRYSDLVRRYYRSLAEGAAKK